MKTFISIVVFIGCLFYFGRGQCHKSEEVKVAKIKVEKPTTPTPEKPKPPTVNSSQPKGWTPTMVDDGFTWFIPYDSTKTTEWFDISDWKVMDRLKAPAIMEFKTKGDSVVTFKVDGKNRHLKKQDGTFSDQQWSDEEYSRTAKGSIALRYSPISPDQPLKVRVGRRSY